MLQGEDTLSVGHFYWVSVTNLLTFLILFPKYSRCPDISVSSLGDNYLVHCFTPCPRRDQGGFPWNLPFLIRHVYGQDQPQNWDSKNRESFWQPLKPAMLDSRKGVCGQGVKSDLCWVRLNLLCPCAFQSCCWLVRLSPMHSHRCTR